MSIGSDVIERAMQVAMEAHKGQKRKGTDVPYITHPLSVGMILAKTGADEEVIAAGILHDTVEDTALNLSDIESEFGGRIARLVEGASEPDKSLSWKARKEHTIAYLKSAPMDVRMLACADKLHNIQAIKRDYNLLGDHLWSRFNKGKEDQEWYYRNVVESLGFNKSFNLLEKLRNEVDEVFGNAKLLEVPKGIRPRIFFALLLEHRYGRNDSNLHAVQQHGIKEELDTVLQEAERIRDEDVEYIESMYHYLSEHGVQFVSNSEGPEILLAFLASMKRVFGLYDYQIWEHVGRDAKKGSL